MVGVVAQQLPQPVALALVALIPSRHAVRLVDDHQIPVDLLQPWQDLGALGKVQRGDDLLLLHPLVDAELIADVAALQDEELFVELLLQLALPLEGEVRGADHENPFDESAQLQLPDQEAGHDGLASAGVVRQQEAHAGELEEVIVDRFELVGQGIHARDGEPEVGVELVGDAEGIGLEAEAQEPSVAVEGRSGVGDGQAGEVVGGERDLTEPLGLLAHEADHAESGTVRADGHHPHGLAEQGAGEHLAFADHGVSGHRRTFTSLPMRTTPHPPAGSWGSRPRRGRDLHPGDRGHPEMLMPASPLPLRLREG